MYLIIEYEPNGGKLGLLSDDDNASIFVSGSAVGRWTALPKRGFFSGVESDIKKINYKDPSMVVKPHRWRRRVNDWRKDRAARQCVSLQHTGVSGTYLPAYHLRTTYLKLSRTDYRNCQTGTFDFSLVCHA